MKAGFKIEKSTFFILLILVLFSSVMLINLNGQLKSSLSTNVFNNTHFSEFNHNNTLNIAANDPNGKPLLVNQYANISRTFTDVGTNQNITFPVAPGWIS